MSAAGGPPAPPARPPGSRYGWFVGVLVVLVLSYITLNTLRTGAGHLGVPVGQPLPAFAAPLALGSLNGDVNVATRANEGRLGNRPACSLRGAQILNSCVLVARGPLALAFFVNAGSCPAALDHLARVAAAFRGLQVAAIALRGDRGSLRALVRQHRWPFPVGYDRDGVLANLYGVATCPQLTFAYPGGIAQGDALRPNELDDAALRARLRALYDASRARGWRPPQGARA